MLVRLTTKRLVAFLLRELAHRDVAALVGDAHQRQRFGRHHVVLAAFWIHSTSRSPRGDSV